MMSRNDFKVKATSESSFSHTENDGDFRSLGTLRTKGELANPGLPGKCLLKWCMYVCLCTSM